MVESEQFQRKPCYVMLACNNRMFASRPIWQTIPHMANSERTALEAYSVEFQWMKDY